MGDLLFQGAGSLVVEHRLNCSEVCGILIPQLGIESASRISCPGRGTYLLSVIEIKIHAVQKAEKWEAEVLRAPAVFTPEESPGTCDGLFRTRPDGRRGVSCISAGTQAGSSWSMKGRVLSLVQWLESLALGLVLCEAGLGSSGLSPRPAFSPPFCLLWTGSPSVLSDYC